MLQMYAQGVSTITVLPDLCFIDNGAYSTCKPKIVMAESCSLMKHKENLSRLYYVCMYLYL